MAKTVVIIGASSGIGKALAVELAEPGVTLCLLARRLEKLEQLSAQVEDKGARAIGVQVDLTVEGALKEFLENQLKETPVIDEVYHCAACSSFGEVHHFSAKDWSDLYKINMLAVVDVISNFYPQLTQQRKGKLVLLSSLAGYTGYPTSAPYAAFKEGIIGLFRSLRHETAYYGVSLHLVIPGFVKTQIFQKAMYREYTEAAAMKSIKSLGLPMVSKEKAAEAIHRGVKKGKEVIMFPFYVRLFIYIAQLFPIALNPFYKKLLSGCPKSTAS